RRSDVGFLERFVMGSVWRWPVWCALALAAPVPASSDSTEEDLATNRRQLERWRSDPDHLARLKRDYRALLALPPDRLARMRQLDRDLHQKNSKAQAKLWRIL